jgi:hypothetical protein
MFNQKILENELSNRSKRNIRFSYETYYSSDLNFFRKLLVDGKEIGIKIDLNQLQVAERDGTLEEKYEELLTEIRRYLIIKR